MNEKAANVQKKNFRRSSESLENYCLRALEETTRKSRSLEAKHKAYMRGDSRPLYSRCNKRVHIVICVCVCICMYASYHSQNTVCQAFTTAWFPLWVSLNLFHVIKVFSSQCNTLVSAICIIAVGKTRFKVVRFRYKYFNLFVLAFHFRLSDHVADKTKQPILIFPEGAYHNGCNLSRKQPKQLR